ncbi:MAG: amino acid ABC transporter permease [Anaerovoracaceae bacterium]
MENYIQGFKIALSGVGTTLSITSVGVILGVTIGLIVAIMRISNNKILKGIAVVYVEILRGTPLLVQACIAYFGIPMILQSNGIDFRYESALVCGMVVCGINSSAYVSEIFRAGLNSIDVGQMEAARSLGMTYFQTMRFVIVPQAFRVVLPSLANEFITLIKETSVLSVITISEVTRKSMLWTSATFLPWPGYLGTAAVYLMMTIPLSKGVNILERKLSKNDKSK